MPAQRDRRGRTHLLISTQADRKKAIIFKVDEGAQYSNEAWSNHLLAAAGPPMPKLASSSGNRIPATAAMAVRPFMSSACWYHLSLDLSTPRLMGSNPKSPTREPSRWAGRVDPGHHEVRFWAAFWGSDERNAACQVSGMATLSSVL
jgi:hypothetical protein